MPNRIKRLLYKLQEKKELKDTFIHELNEQKHYNSFNEDIFVCAIPKNTIHTDKEIKNYYDKLFAKHIKYK